VRALLLLLAPLLACADASPSATATAGAAPPEAEARAPALEARLEAAWAARPADYVPRTRHLEPDGAPRYVNRLFLESSPYLRQHAHNPVDWYPWGDEAFEAARRLGRPVLLSVGYSTCHWCHVMEEESFEDEEIAAYLNANYVAIKVDREERPDVDAIYMSAVHLIQGRGGWPMTVWLTPGRDPYYGGTYYPPRDGARGGRPGFLSLLARMKAAYDEEPDRVASSGARLAAAIRESLAAPPAGEAPPGAEALRAALDAYDRRFDNAWGGLSRAPKFPSGLSIRLLLRQHRRLEDPRALEMASLTLEKMAAGGMYDHVGGGFHRYSTDARWLVPHFEKMLYDNALLAVAYLEGAQATGRADFARVARQTLDYVARDMTAPGGGFYSSTDADSANPEGHREEGWFFTWTADELVAALGEEDGALAAALWAVTPGGNFEGRSVLHTPRPLAAVAAEAGVEAAALEEKLPGWREALYRAREARPAPLRDEKILTSWNGLMISAFARGAQVLQEPEYARRAAAAAGFVLGELRVAGRLRRSFKDGAPRHAAYLDDYAFLIAGLLDLFEATGEPRWLREAIALEQVLQAHYADAQAGGWFFTADDAEALLTREKPSRDGAEPSGGSVQVMNLLRLAALTGRADYRARAEGGIRSMAGVVERAPTALAELLVAVDWTVGRPREVVIVTAPGQRADAAPFEAALAASFLPDAVGGVTEGGGPAPALVPLVAHKTALGGQATAYVCEEGICELPTDDPAVFARQLQPGEVR